MSRPLYPAIFNADEAHELKWAQRPENESFYRHLLNISNEFPSILMAFSADDGLADIAIELGKSFIDKGINIFLPSEATPICAFSQSIGVRQVPLGLYLSIDKQKEMYSLAALTNHGGPLDEQDIIDKKPEENERHAVLGETEYDRIYLNNLSGFADQFIEDGAGFSEIQIPFAGLEQKLRRQKELGILFTPDKNGPKAIISNDGQGLKIVDNGKELADNVICDKIIDYLVKERRASGTVVGPAGLVEPADITGEIVEVDGDLYDMNYHAGFSDLLIGWWHGGIIAHQGSSCFGDGILTALYYLEALRS
jgi:hypothetical protein